MQDEVNTPYWIVVGEIDAMTAQIDKIERHGSLLDVTLDPALLASLRNSLSALRDDVFVGWDRATKED